LPGLSKPRSAFASGFRLYYRLLLLLLLLLYFIKI